MVLPGSGTALINGRAIEARDSIDAPKVAVVNQAFVKRFLKPGENVIGRHMSVGAGNIPLDIEIIGVAADTRHSSLRETVKPTFFRSYEQAQKGRPRNGAATFFIRSSSPVPAPPFAPAWPSRIRSCRSTACERWKSSGRRDHDRPADGRFGGGFWRLGVIDYRHRPIRRPELSNPSPDNGIRYPDGAGATRGNILRLVFREVLLLVGAGALVGAIAALGAGQAVAAQLFGVNRFDPVVLIAAPLLLAIVALAAASTPSFKAATVQPLEALRHE